MTFHHGYLLVQEANGYRRELFNHARTAAYLSNSSALGCGTIYNVLDDGGCAGYAWMPPGTLENVLTDNNGEILTDTEGEPIVAASSVSPSGWFLQSYSTPSLDPAPWYNSSFPESAQALGFWITEWTGLDSSHIQREVTQVGAYRGGGVMGALGSRSREMGFEIIMFGESEKALDYLFRWLDATLSSVCSTCATDSIILRRFCPEIDPLDYDTAAEGAVEMREVGLISGLQWGAPPIERAGCFIRRANFTLGAADPCMYGFCTDVAITQTMDWDACFAAANLNPDRTNCRPFCSEMSGDCRTVINYTIDDPSGGGPIIELTPPLGSGSTIPIRIRTYANPNGLLADELCGAPLLGELYVASLPEWTELRYDVVGRRIEIRSPGTGDWINGFAYIGPNDVGVPRFFYAGCGDYTTIVEPADFCLEDTPLPDLSLLAGVQSANRQSDGKILAFGSFATVDGITVNGLARLTGGGYVDTGFNTGGTVGVSPANAIRSAIQLDSKIIIGGDFTAARGTTVNRIARLNDDGSLDAGFNVGGTVGVSDTVIVIAIQPDGMIVIGGLFTTARGTTVNRIARLAADGSLDATFNIGGTIGVDAAVQALAIQPDGKIVIGGAFLNARGSVVNRIARLNTDGTLDPGFDIVTGTVGVASNVRAIAIQPDGKIVIGGAFTTARGTTVNNFARLESNGLLDATFNTGGSVGTNGEVRAIALLSDGQMLIGGAFTTARGTTVNRIARINAYGSLDTTFNVGGTVGVDGTVVSILPYPDGRILIGGAFSNARGVPMYGVARLLEDGSLDPTFLATDVGGYVAQPEATLSTQQRMGCA